ncbi:AI-2E family transporter [Candidatus Magnetominusculus dajiuhuensis]|uniref:AI-2E family transporter n=1 Tax=Candidatus Magnetominusculus dajiuhuensis TaxID=3137712 RepID=UPI003B438B1F
MSDDRPDNGGAGVVISNYDVAAWAIVALLLFLVLKLHLLAALLSGLLVFELIHALSCKIKVKGLTGHASKMIVIALLGAVIVTVVFFLGLGAAGFFRGSSGNYPALLQKMADIIDNSLSTLPEWITNYLPSDAEGVKSAVSELLRKHAAELQSAGKEAAKTAAHVLIGMVMGVLAALNEISDEHECGPLAKSLMGSVSKVAVSFRRIVFAQMRISAINTCLAALYLAVILPLFGVHLALIKTMITITFLVGLLPVVGNLISNTVIIVVSLSNSFNVAAASMGFLVVVHKLEYFLNAKIVGTQIKSKTWEMLLAMLVMEAAFGLPGVIAAPIYYAYLKEELIEKGLI